MLLYHFLSSFAAYIVLLEDRLSLGCAGAMTGLCVHIDCTINIKLNQHLKGNIFKNTQTLIVRSINYKILLYQLSFCCVEPHRVSPGLPQGNTLLCSSGKQEVKEAVLWQDVLQSESGLEISVCVHEYTGKIHS